MDEIKIKRNKLKIIDDLSSYEKIDEDLSIILSKINVLLDSIDVVREWKLGLNVKDDLFEEINGKNEKIIKMSDDLLIEIESIMGMQETTLQEFDLIEIKESDEDKFRRFLPDITGDPSRDSAIKDEIVYVIEANPRASRTVPFIAKAYNEPYTNYATKVMLGKKKISDFDFNPTKNGYAIKVPVFSFDKFHFR